MDDKNLVVNKNLDLSADNEVSSENNNTSALLSKDSSDKPCNEETDGSISMTSSEKQEWSVTLYDVDRKGNVSEEDLARLVTMLYKAAGSSITTPQEGNGTKKIKLRLSVAPDQNHTKVFIQKPNTNKKNDDTTTALSSKQPSNHNNQPTTAQQPLFTSIPQPLNQSVNADDETKPHHHNSARKERKYHRSSHKYPMATNLLLARNSNTTPATDVDATTEQPADATQPLDAVSKAMQDKENVKNSKNASSHLLRSNLHRKRSKKRHSRTHSADNNKHNHLLQQLQSNQQQQLQEVNTSASRHHRSCHYSRSTERYGCKKKSQRSHHREQPPENSVQEPSGPVLENMDRRQYYKDLVGIENETLQSLEVNEERSDKNTKSSCNDNNTSQGLEYKSQTVFLPSTKDKEYKSRMNKKQVHFEGKKDCGLAFFSCPPAKNSTKKSRTAGYGRSRPKSCGPTIVSSLNSCGLLAANGGVFAENDNEIFIDTINNNSSNLHTTVEESDNKNNNKIANALLTESINCNTAAAVSPTSQSSPHHQPVAVTTSSSSPSPNKPLLTVHTDSPHHLRRHRNREQEYNRSMKQVAQWVQKQHTYVTAAAAATAAVNSESLVHEHHHIHEHHHHYHFYHYYET